MLTEDEMSDWRFFAIAATVMALAAPAAQAAAFDLERGGHGLLVRIDTRVDEMPAEMGTAYVIGIQEELIVHGYTPGPVDGKPGRRTAAAIRAYQRDAGLAVTGVPTRELLDHLKFVLPKVNARTPAAAGAPSQALASDVQRHLQQRGYYTAAIDGRIGPATRQAVRDFQAAAGLPVTGVVDARLLAEIKLAD